jgi:dsRNA-specific ribonuclease
MPSTTVDAIVQQATSLASQRDGAEAVESLIAAAGDRTALEAARDQVAAHLHSRVDDWEATATLTLLNQALSKLPRVDPLDWRMRWAKHRKP